jgi:hypothetical protein
MKRCGACGKQIRSGTMIYASDGKGGLARKRLGKCCAALAVPVLVGGIEAARCKCGSPATSCVGCVRDAERADPKKLLSGAITKIRNTAKAYARTGAGDTEVDQLIAGLNQAADILEGGDF